MESGMSIQVQRDLNKAKDVQQHEECSIMSRIIQLSTTNVSGQKRLENSEQAMFSLRSNGLLKTYHFVLDIEIRRRRVAHQDKKVVQVRSHNNYKANLRFK